ncbi:MAG: NDP-sugar synthase [bacterium]
MKAMILAAGFGTRLSELGLALPKPLYPVCNVSLIRHAVAHLVGHGITEIMVNLHHQGELIRAELGDGRALGAVIHYSLEEGQILGTGGGVKRALPFFEGETFVLMNGKIVIDLDLHAAIALHRGLGAAATMVLKPDPRAAEWGAIGVDPAGRIRRFLEAPDPLPEDVTEHMFTGIHILEPTFIEALPDGPCCIVQAGYRPAFASGAVLGGWVHEGYFWDHSSPSRFLQGNLNLVNGSGRSLHPPGPLRGAHPTADIHQSARIDDTVLIGAGARIEADAVLGPEVVIGSGATVPAGCRLSRTLVFAGARARGDADSAVIAPDGTVLAVDLDEVGPRTGPALKQR